MLIQLPFLQPCCHLQVTLSKVKMCLLVIPNTILNVAQCRIRSFTSSQSFSILKNTSVCFPLWFIFIGITLFSLKLPSVAERLGFVLLGVCAKIINGPNIRYSEQPQLPRFFIPTSPNAHQQHYGNSKGTHYSK